MEWTGDTLLSHCQVCQGIMFYQECPTGGWWIHVHHPADDHDAR